MSPLRIDTAEFTRRGEHAEGRLELASLERLATLLESTDGTLDWRLDGRSVLRPDGSRQPLLGLRLEGRMAMRCVRCLDPVEVALEVSRDYRLVSSEAQAEGEDLDDDDRDLLVGDRGFDLAALIEDEAIMALPAAPRHADCRIAAATSGLPPAEEARRPFEVLERLRGRGAG
jgi:uncharacterized protein